MNDQANAVENTLETTATKVSALASRIDETVKKAQARLTDLQHAAADKTREAAESADVYVHQHPWQAIGAAATIGLVLGLILGRR